MYKFLVTTSFQATQTFIRNAVYSSRAGMHGVRLGLQRHDLPISAMPLFYMVRICTSITKLDPCYPTKFEIIWPAFLVIFFQAVLSNHTT